MRAILIILDSFGIGGAPDAGEFGDEGANTLGHIAEVCASGAVSPARPDPGPLHLPHMASLGLWQALDCADGTPLAAPDGLRGAWAAATEIGRGKDTPSGHWEIMGCPVMDPPRVFPDQENAFPAELIAEIMEVGDVPGMLGNCHAGGTAIVDALGAEHLRTGKPIVYTSVDSVLQIAAHEDAFGLDRLMRLCEVTRKIADRYKIGRVIARPFIGKDGHFERTGNRRDFTMPPQAPTILDRLQEAAREVIAIGKIGDIFAHRGISENRKAFGTDALFDLTVEAMDDLPEGGLLFANYVDFDTLYGHGRDPLGYAAALEALDARLPELFAAQRPGDMLILSADHGNDPTWRGKDHTRERVPVLIRGGRRTTGLGLRHMADIGVSIAAHLGVEYTGHGQSFLDEIGGVT
ncbi:phosphopentomutase [Roseovarius faecimaris]|uniref:Phosphopentomutase n=1 Tax=Roseovarius faecimaris TaxID=2494550 RepID=A0A6I6IV67_9RHOB|nr:phosphopentomutase [Roseovarius faecimaris]QGX99793.1 phosphopentomutase [Roseovarius faecimaris]